MVVGVIRPGKGIREGSSGSDKGNAAIKSTKTSNIGMGSSKDNGCGFAKEDGIKGLTSIGIGYNNGIEPGIKSRGIAGGLSIGPKVGVWRRSTGSYYRGGTIRGIKTADLLSVVIGSYRSIGNQ